jgi:excisionase family DNA binding protein
MQTPLSKREWLAPKELASELGVHVSTVYRAVERGDLPVVRLGGRSTSIRIRATALETEPQP